jgi:hypothetical protein
MNDLLYNACVLKNWLSEIVCAYVFPVEADS